jgi:hypothetical protein
MATRGRGRRVEVSCQVVDISWLDRTFLLARPWRYAAGPRYKVRNDSIWKGSWISLFLYALHTLAPTKNECILPLITITSCFPVIETSQRTIIFSTSQLYVTNSVIQVSRMQWSTLCTIRIECSVFKNLKLRREESPRGVFLLILVLLPLSSRGSVSTREKSVKLVTGL